MSVEETLVGVSDRVGMDAERVRSDVLRFLEEQLRLRSVVGLKLGGVSKDEKGYPDVVLGMSQRAHAMWVEEMGKEETSECRHMREKMTGGWICHRVRTKVEVLEALSKVRG